MAVGEPPDRHVTKIGGLPYRPAQMPWPTTDDDTPMSFLAQINFADSKDITGDLPGDLLLAFTPDSDGCIETLHCEWQPLGLGDLISTDALPDQAWRPDPCYGYIFRTASYPEAKRRTDAANTKYPICRGLEIWSDFHLLQYQATQIATAPFFIQPGDDDLPGRILCAISSVQPPRHEPYPWINRSDPLMPKDVWRYDDNYLMLGDMGCIYISIDEAGDLHFTQSCY